ncbi:MAG: ROK family protein [Planctomycetota bacterium]|nr:ROK family protein [Planctomycetota bacterium]
MSKILWGIDLGGTKIEGVVLEEASPHPLCRIRIPTEAEKGYDHILSQIYTLIEELRKSSKINPSQIGMGTPGTLDPENHTLKNSNTTCLIGKHLQSDLEKKLGIPIHIENDANCFTLAEARWGAAKGAQTAFGIILGTGVGGGIVLQGKPLTGRHGIAGEWGHNPLDPQGPDCYCGRVGCVETIISGPALEEYYRTRTGKIASLEEISNEVDSDSAARETIERLTTHFGKALAAVVNILDPDIIVLGGGVSHIKSLYTEGPAEVQKHLFHPTLLTPIVPNKLGDSAGVFGAALLNS